MKPALILAMGECLAISAALDLDLIEIPRVVVNATLRLYEGGDPSVLEGLSLEDRILAYTIAYGGLMLFYTCNPVTPISRVHLRTGISLGELEESSTRLSDRLILRAWALIYYGLEEEGLKLIEGVTYYPLYFKWRVGGEIKVIPVAVSF